MWKIVSSQGDKFFDMIKIQSSMLLPISVAQVIDKFLSVSVNVVDGNSKVFRKSSLTYFIFVLVPVVLKPHCS